MAEETDTAVAEDAAKGAEASVAADETTKADDVDPPKAKNDNDNTSKNQPSPDRASSVGPGMEGFRKRATVRFSATESGIETAAATATAAAAADLGEETEPPASGVMTTTKSVRATLNKSQVEQLMAEPSMEKLEEGKEEEEEKEKEEGEEEGGGDSAVAKKKPAILVELEHPRNAGNKEFTVIAFVNAASGGRMGEQVYQDLVKLLGEDFVFDLSKVSKGNMPEDILIKYCLDPKVRVLACGGDGTMGWIESALDAVWARVLGPGVSVETTKYKKHLPLAIMPLGTGNDLSRTFGWGKRYNKKMGKPEMVSNVIHATPEALDRWRCVVIPDDALDEDTKAWIPEMLGSKTPRNSDVAGSIFEKKNAPPKIDDKKKSETGDSGKEPEPSVESMSMRKMVGLGPKSEDIAASPEAEPPSEGQPSPEAEPPSEGQPSPETEPPSEGDPADPEQPAPEPVAGDQEGEESELLDGIFCNYLSIGYDAQVAFSFHTDRKEHPEKYTSVHGNKLKYATKGITDGTNAPKLHGKLRVFVTNREGSNDSLMELEVPKRCRAVALLNIPNYAGGIQVARTGKRDDALIDVIFMTTVWRFALISGVSKLLPFTRYTVAAKVSRVCIKTHETLHCQVDGEPWKQGAATINVRHFGKSAVLQRKKEKKAMPWSCGGKWATGA